MLHKNGVDDNISFYGDNRGKHDLVLDIYFAESFHKNFIKPQKIDTKDQLADLLTKSLPYATFVHLRNRILHTF